MIGSTPQLSTAVWVGNVDGSALYNSYGGIMYGSQTPGDLWKYTMDNALANKDFEYFTKPESIGGVAGAPQYQAPSTSDYGYDQGYAPEVTEEESVEDSAPESSEEQPAPVPDGGNGGGTGGGIGGGIADLLPIPIPGGGGLDGGNEGGGDSGNTEGGE